jgi:hypothetical protein
VSDAERMKRAASLGLCPVCEHGHDGVPCGLCPCELTSPGTPTGAHSSSPTTARPDTSNRHTVRPAVGLDGWIAFGTAFDAVVVTEDSAVNLAAWLVAMVPGGRRRFDAMLAEITKA